jgi:DNA-binding transcriptional MerR regulator
MRMLEPKELDRIERDFSGGLLARQILEIFRPRGVRLSEATFRKYVQVGLLPRSRRVGRKGKHQGSRGLYPVEAVRRINAIKKMMAEGHTLEDIKRSFLVHRNHIDQLERNLSEVFNGLQDQLGTREREDRRTLEARLGTLRSRARALIRDVARLGSAVSAQRNEKLHSQVG